MKFTLRKV